jgi:hypothetical protein
MKRASDRKHDLRQTLKWRGEECDDIFRASGLRSNVSFGAKSLMCGTDSWAGLLATGSHY